MQSLKMKQIILMACASLLLINIAWAEQKLITDKQGFEVKPIDVDVLLKLGPKKSQLELLKNPANFQEKLEQIYLTKVVAAEYKNQSRTPEEQAELDKQVDMVYLQAKVNELTTQNLPDFEVLAKKEYEANKAEYLAPEQVIVEHLMIDSRKHGEKEALKLVNKVKESLKKGESYSKLVEKYTEDPTFKENHGKLGPVGRGVLMRDLDVAAFKLKEGEVSEPIKSGYGYHLLKKIQQINSAPKEYEVAKQEIIDKLRKKFIEGRLEDYYQHVKQENSMTVDAKAIETYAAEKVKQLEQSLSNEIDSAKGAAVNSKP